MIIATGIMPHHQRVDACLPSHVDKIPLIRNGQWKNQDGGKQNGESPCYLK